MSLRGCHSSTNTLMETASFLVVRLGGNYLGLPSVGVHGMLTLEETSHEQAITAGGIIYQPVELAKRLSIIADLSGHETRTVLYSIGGSRGAICVEHVVGLMDVEHKDCLPLPPQFQCDERNWFGGMLVYQDQLVLILNPSWVLGESSSVVSIHIEQAEQLVEITPAVVGSC
jgi:chemotaxis signal transduction protein